MGSRGGGFGLKVSRLLLIVGTPIMAPPILGPQLGVMVS